MSGAATAVSGEGVHRGAALRCAAFAALLLLSACGTPGELVERTLPEPPVPARFGALEYLAWLQDAPPAELGVELERLEQEGPRASLVDKVQLALLLSASSRADAEGKRRAREILGTVGREFILAQRSRDYLTFAGVWHSVLMLRDRLAAASGSLDALRLALEEAQARNARSDLELKSARDAREEGERQVEELELQIKSLKKQIEALTSIEQQLIERERQQ